MFVGRINARTGGGGGHKAANGLEREELMKASQRDKTIWVLRGQ